MHRHPTDLREGEKAATKGEIALFVTEDRFNENNKPSLEKDRNDARPIRYVRKITKPYQRRK